MGLAIEEGARSGRGDRACFLCRWPRAPRTPCRPPRHAFKFSPYCLRRIDVTLVDPRALIGRRIKLQKAGDGVRGKLREATVRAYDESTLKHEVCVGMIWVVD